MGINGKYKAKESIRKSGGWHHGKDLIDANQNLRSIIEITLSLIDDLDDRIVLLEQNKNLIASPTSTIGATIVMLNKENVNLANKVEKLSTKLEKKLFIVT